MFFRVRGVMAIGVAGYFALGLAVTVPAAAQNTVGQLLYSISSTPDDNQYGSAYAVIGDITGDGLSDYAVSSPFSFEAAGMCPVWTGRPLAFVDPDGMLSVAGGGGGWGCGYNTVTNLSGGPVQLHVDNGDFFDAHFPVMIPHNSGSHGRMFGCEIDGVTVCCPSGSSNCKYFELADGDFSGCIAKCDGGNEPSVKCDCATLPFHSEFDGPSSFLCPVPGGDVNGFSS